MNKKDVTILIVDDNQQLRQPLRVYLQRQGYHVIEADDGLGAMAAAVEHIPDAIILDVMMPVVDGFEVLKRLKKKDSTRNIPVLMLTAVNEKESIVKGLASGVGDYLIKGSAGIRDISQRLERLLKARGNQSESTHENTVGNSEQRIISDSKLQQVVEELTSPNTMPTRMAEVLSIFQKTACTVQDWKTFLDKNKHLAEIMAVLAGVGLPENVDEGGSQDDFLLMLGTRRLGYLALAAATLASFAELPGQEYLHLLNTAVMAGSIAGGVLGGAFDEALAAGMLHDFGRVLLRNRFPGQYETIINRAKERKMPLLSLEREMLGIDHADLGGDMLMAWGGAAGTCGCGQAASLYVAGHHEPRFLQPVSCRGCSTGRRPCAYVELG